MRERMTFYIDGQWREPAGRSELEVVNPATESLSGVIPAGESADVDRAVAAARAAFESWSMSSREVRLDLLKRIVSHYERRFDDLVDAIVEEMGAPVAFARQAQVPLALNHIVTAIEVLRTFPFEERRQSTGILHEPIGVCGLITPWNWPLNQIACKVAPALATGCTMVLKPSEIAPYSANIFAEIMHEAGTPAGVFNMVHGTGPVVGAAMARHPQIDMISITGSTRAGVEVARAAAGTVKRVHQELGGKSANIVLDDEVLPRNVARCINLLMANSGQTCTAPTRLLVPHHRMEEAMSAAAIAAGKITVGDPLGNARIGPVVSQAQWEKVQDLIRSGIEEGATLVAGGLGRPDGLDRGYFVRPTVFANVHNDMRIAREEIFGPVASILAYADLEDAIAIANDTPYGLAGYVNGADVDQARAVARRLRCGQVNINGAAIDPTAPFGGYKASGNGREWGDYAFREFLEVKAVLGYGAVAE
jgi:aldehyde dehydrogenase (NAD+)